MWTYNYKVIHHLNGNQPLEKYFSLDEVRGGVSGYRLLLILSGGHEIGDKLYLTAPRCFVCVWTGPQT